MSGIRVLMALMLAVPVIVYSDELWMMACVLGLQALASLDFRWGDDE